MQAKVSDMPFNQNFFFYLWEWVFCDGTHRQPDGHDQLKMFKVTLALPSKLLKYISLTAKYSTT